jgi:alcohol dehydrogenase
VAIGPRAAQRWGVTEGDRVAVEVFQSCRRCSSCLGGEYRRCERHGLADMYGFIPVDRRSSARILGRLRRIPVPGTRLDAIAGGR